MTETIGDGDCRSVCPQCETEYRTDEPERARAEARDHKEWHPRHFPFAEDASGARIYG